MIDLAKRNEAIRAAMARYRDTHVLCPDAPDCRFGHIATDPDDIDSYTGEPRRSHCPTCKGVGFVHIQLELPF